jgi:glutathione synthase/RimK-type ligase-like ATP-grasp enzyme
MAHNVDPPDGLRNLAKRAVAACNYDLGAVDILETATGGVVLEVNSRPAVCSPYTLERYAQAFRTWSR